MAFNFEKTLEIIKKRQWALADVDWDAPGRELIAPEQRPKLKAFMTDIMWIEHVGARGFAALAKKAPNETLREIYRYFHAEEQKHANAEMALLRRWGMLEDERLPEPNINVRLVIEWLDRYSDEVTFGALASVIPMLEVALDGALLKFLLETIDDPVCREVFIKINDDESRHLAVGFHVLELLGHSPTYRRVLEFAAGVLSPKLIVGALVYMPLLNRMRDNIVDLGLSESRLYEAMKKYRRVGSRTPEGRRNPWFQLISQHGRVVIDRRHPYHVPVDALVRLTSRIPSRALGPIPSWVRELTWQPTA